MAWAHVGTGTVNSGITVNSVATTYASVVVGNAMVVCISTAPSGATISSVTDSGSNSYILVGTQNGVNMNSAMYYSIITTGGSLTITANFATSASSCSITADQYSFSAGTVSIGNTATNTDSGSTGWTTGSLAFTQSCMVIGTLSENNPAAVATWASPLTLRNGVAEVSGTSLGISVGDDLNTTSSPINPSGTWGTGGTNYNSVGAIFLSSGDILASGTASTVSVGSTIATVTVANATGGQSPYTYQWYRSTTTGFTPGGGNIVSGATSQTLNDTGLTNGTTYFYKNIVTDNASNTATSNQASATPSASPASIVIHPTSVTASTTGNSIIVTGTNTSWTPGTPGSPTFTASAGTITGQTITSGTSATLTYTAPTSGPVTITDPSTASTATLSIANAPPSGLTVGSLPSRDITTGMGFVFGVDGGYHSGICEILPGTVTANIFAPGVLPSGSGSVNIVYASVAGVPACNPNNAQAGPDATAALQAILNTAQTKPLILVIDQCCLAQNLNIYSGTTIQGLGAFDNFNGANTIPAGLFMGTITNGTNSCILKNAHWRSPYQGGTIVDQNITIKDLYLDGQGTHNISGSGTKFVNTAGQFVGPIQIFGCTNLTVENVSIYNPAGYAQQYANINYGYFHNLSMFCPAQFTNPAGGDDSAHTDGFHINGPASNIILDGFNCTAGDDSIALNSADGNLSTTINITSGPQIFGGFSAVYYGDITQVICTNIVLDTSFDVCRFLVGGDPRGGAFSNISQVIIDNVVGTVGEGMHGENFSQVTQGGTISQVVLSNWQLSGIQANAAHNFLFGQHWNDVLIENFRLYNLPVSSVSSFYQIVAESDLTMTNMTIKNMEIIEDSGETTTPVVPILISGGTIDELNLLSCRWNRHSVSNLVFLSMTGGTVNRINMVGCSFNNINSAINISAGTAGGVNLTGLSHRGANGIASLVLGSGVTLARLRAAGLDTALLTSGGTITSEKTDSTQDA